MPAYFQSRQGAATLSVASNTTLIVLKIIVGLLTGSVSVLSEAIHSSADLLAAIIAFFSIRAASRPADTNHQFGHGKAESLSAVIEALLIFAGAAYIIFEAVDHLIHGLVITNLGWGVGVMALSSTANFFISRHLFRLARANHSPALEADAWHLATDLYTGVGVGLGLALVWFTGLTALDPLIAMGVALLILKAAWDITHLAVGDLLDESLPAPDESRIRNILAAHAGLYSRVRRIRTRRGPTPHVEVALEFPSAVSLPDAHALTEHLEEEVRRVFPQAEVVVEAEPPPAPTNPSVAEDDCAEDERENVIQQIQRVTQRLGLVAHHLSADVIRDHYEVNLHLEVDSALSLHDAHELATRVEDEIKREVPGVTLVTSHIEPAKTHSQNVANEARVREQIMADLSNITRALPEVRDIHDVTVHRRDNHFSVSLHCALDGVLPIERAHRIGSEIEARLKRTHPTIENVFVHTEPENDARGAA